MAASCPTAYLANAALRQSLQFNALGTKEWCKFVVCVFSALMLTVVVCQLTDCCRVSTRAQRLLISGKNIH
jgi:hypothetical protein